MRGWGLIPAHAGKTRRPRRRRGEWTAHPRSRGENLSCGHDDGSFQGSSPLTRGKLPHRGSGRKAGRLIPAHAGKTGPNQPGSCFSLGSSPLTRGKLYSYRNRALYRGLIPAHAGKTSGCPSRRPGCRAHPRSRGENGFPSPSTVWTTGSSPLTRGKPGGPRGTHPRGGLIPAHAGKTFPARIGRGTVWAHPRSRGENSGQRAPPGVPGGSSPLTRGKRRLLISHRKRLGLIPAHAGKTSASTDRTRRRRAHPRSRGENDALLDRRRRRGGSSPLTRGKQHRVILHEEVPGLIPAHAGKTSASTAWVP